MDFVIIQTDDLNWIDLKNNGYFSFLEKNKGFEHKIVVVLDLKASSLKPMSIMQMIESQPSILYSRYGMLKDSFEYDVISNTFVRKIPESQLNIIAEAVQNLFDFDIVSSNVYGVE